MSDLSQKYEKLQKFSTDNPYFPYLSRILGEHKFSTIKDLMKMLNFFKNPKSKNFRFNADHRISKKTKKKLFKVCVIDYMVIDCHFRTTCMWKLGLSPTIIVRIFSKVKEIELWNYHKTVSSRDVILFRTISRNFSALRSLKLTAQEYFPKATKESISLVAHLVPIKVSMVAETWKSSIEFDIVPLKINANQIIELWILLKSRNQEQHILQQTFDFKLNDRQLKLILPGTQEKNMRKALNMIPKPTKFSGYLDLIAR